MITVGIRNLKDSLSKYLKMVRGGERIVITDHNRIIAEIIPATASSETDSRLLNYVKEKIESGAITAARTRTVLSLERTENRIEQKKIDRIYEETRNERS